MPEDKTVSKPAQLWNSALRAVKGETTGQLVEQFTSEMTLVAEGLCEDQARLRKSLEDLQREQDRAAQCIRSDVQALESALQERERDTDRRLDDLSRRLSAIESRQKAIESEKTSRRDRHDKTGLIRQLTVLAAIIAGAWVIVTVLNLFK